MRRDFLNAFVYAKHNINLTWPKLFKIENEKLSVFARIYMTLSHAITSQFHSWHKLPPKPHLYWLPVLFFGIFSLPLSLSALFHWLIVG